MFEINKIETNTIYSLWLLDNKIIKSLIEYLYFVKNVVRKLLNNLVIYKIKSNTISMELNKKNF